MTDASPDLRATPGDDALPLSGVRVIDLITGPVGAIGRTLAELGAEVIRVEPRAGRSGAGPPAPNRASSGS
jgi:crotonobetainyl-CoA:carnitine CoA-transferase CaiB-like acyl-CoA transferase